MSSSSEKVGFALTAVSTEQFAINERAFLNGNSVELSSGFDFRANAEDNRIGVFFPLEFRQKGNPFIMLEVACHFRLSSSSWKEFFDKKNGTLVLPKNMAQHLAMLTVGTARGVLHAKLERTPYGHYLLPAINLTTMIKNDVVINI